VGIVAVYRRVPLSARLHSYLKKHPRLRQAVLRSYTAADRVVARLRRSLDPVFPEPALAPPTEQWIREWNAGSGRPADIKFVRIADEITNLPPRSIHGFVDEEYRMAQKVFVPPAFVATIPGGRVVGEHGAVVTPDNQLLQDVSWPVGSLRSYMLGDHGTVPGGKEFYVDAALPAKRIKGNVAVLSSFVGRGYFHWLWDVLPRLGLLNDAGVDLDEIDYFVVPGYFSGFQIETLTTLGIHRSRVLSSLLHRHILADELLVPSLTRPTGVVSVWAAEYLRNAFPPIRPAGDDHPTRIYIVRKATDHGLLAGEDQLTARLARHGFAPVAMENYSLREKAWLLGGAEVVLGPSGAGLCNIVFCRPGTKIVELRVQPYPVMEPWDIANRCGLDFYDVLPDGYGGSEKGMVSSGAISDEAIFSTLEWLDLLRKPND
jgi:capsular polysaccharide biosynthesis protein